MSSIARFTFVSSFGTHTVELDGEPYDSGGVKYVPVKACAGQPFVGGAKAATRTAYTTARVDQLTPIKPNLLELALQHTDKQQWYRGEAVWLVGGPHAGGAFLKAEEGFVTLHLVHYDPSITVFWLDLDEMRWEPSRNLERDYKMWAEEARTVYSRK